MKVREIEDFESLRRNWNVLLKKNIFGNNIFLTWEWLSTWWKYFGEGRKLLLLVVEDEGEVVAIAPFMLSKYKLPIMGTFKKVEFVGVRHSDYNNFIVLKKDKDCLRLIVDYLLDNFADWDWIELKEIPEINANAGSLETLFSNVSSKLKLSSRVCNICPYIPLPNSFDILVKRLSKNMRQNLNKYLRRIKAKHRIEFKRYDEAGFSVNEAMRTFITLHEARWAMEKEPGAFRDNPCFRDFHMEIVRTFANKGWLGLYFLMADDEPISAQYTFEYNLKIYYYLSGFDPRYSQYSVGNLTIMFLLERGIKNGFQEYDMLRGDEFYKKLWTSKYRRNFEFRLIRNSLSCKFYNWLTWNSIVNSIAGKLKLSLKKQTIK